MMEILSSALTKVKKDGILSLLRSAPPYAYNRTLDWSTKAIYHSDCIDRNGLQEMVENGKYWKYGEGGEITVNRAQTVESLPHEFKLMEGSYPTDEAFVAEVENAYIISDHAIGYTADGKPLLDTVRGEQHKFFQALRDTSIRTKRSYSTVEYDLEAVEHDSVFHMAMPVMSYFLWLQEYLPKLQGLVTYEQQTGDEPKILIMSDPPSWVIESLELLGFGRERFVEYDSGPMFVEKLVLSSHAYNFVTRGQYIPPARSTFEWLQKRAIADIQELQSNRIYVSREDASRRRVTNEDEVMDELSDRGFELYKLAEMSIPEQVRLFSNAEVIVGAHGAGLMNQIFSNDPLVVEIVPDEYLKPTQYCVARFLDYDYEFLSAGTVSSESKPMERDIVVNVDSLCRILDARLSSTP